MTHDKEKRSDFAPITPSVSNSSQQELLEKVLSAQERDLAAVESAQRDLLTASPALFRKFLGWTAANEPTNKKLAVGLALAATNDDAALRQLTVRHFETLPVETVANAVDYIHGWYVDRKQVKRERKRFQDEMTMAYEATAGMVRESLQEQAPIGDDFQGGEILVTLGTFDKVQQVLDHLELPYQTLPCNVVDSLPLRADQVLIVNCPGQFSDMGIEKIRRFVAAGGTLITTDWALQTTVERAFPGTIEYTGHATADDVVRVSWIHPDFVYTQGVEVPGQTISWWLEGSSYPIRILDRRVQVLVRSDEMAKKYKEDPLVVMFDYGEGTVFHLTSHYYLQRSQGDKSAKAGTGVVGDKLSAQAQSAGLDAGQVSAAYSSMRLLGNILYDARRKCGV